MYMDVSEVQTEVYEECANLWTDSMRESRGSSLRLKIGALVCVYSRDNSILACFYVLMLYTNY